MAIFWPGRIRRGNRFLMASQNVDLSFLLNELNIGSSVAELDTLLESARVETSVFGDVLNDRVDLIPGTKGSGKSALYRIFVEFLPNFLKENRKIVVAHGVQRQGDSVFQAFNDEFEKLSEDQFVDFWCIYLVSLAHEQFIKREEDFPFLGQHSDQIKKFKKACEKAHIPEIKVQKTLLQVLEWALNVVKHFKPRVSYEIPNDQGTLAVDLFETEKPNKPGEIEGPASQLPVYLNEIRDCLDEILTSSGYSLWLMVDRLDEIFPRRTTLEKRALRGLLRTLRIFSGSKIKVKIFLRDDMLDNIVSGDKGFTALTHVTAKQSDSLKWTEDQILTMIVKRIFNSPELISFYKINKEMLESSFDYRVSAFYKVFPPTIRAGEKQSSTISWIYNRVSDGNGVVTPRDVIDLLGKAKQFQQDQFLANPGGTSEFLFSSSAILHGLEELSVRKKTTYLKAEFPHLWNYIEKFENGGIEYNEFQISKLLDPNSKGKIDQLLSIGFMTKKIKNGKATYWIPYIYRKALNLKQRKA